MLATLLFAPNDDGLTRQPTSMEVIGYQRVQHALADGKPDLKAPNNYFVRTKTQWFLALDSDTLPIDEAGNCHVVVPGSKHVSYEKKEEKGRPRGKLAEAFKWIMPPAGGENGKAVERGWESSGGVDETRPAKQRVLYWAVRTVAEEVETHTEGRRRATRTYTHAHWGSQSMGWPSGKIYVPNREPWVTMEAGPHVQVDPPTYGYRAVVLPKDDDL